MKHIHYYLFFISRCFHSEWMRTVYPLFAARIGYLYGQSLSVSGGADG